METQSITERAIKVFAQWQAVSQDQIKPEARLIEDLGADGLDRAELFLLLADEFGPLLKESESEKLLTVSQVIEYFEQYG